MSEEQTVLYEVKDKVAYITLNRPDSLNALTRAMCKLLRKTWIHFEEDPEARVGIVTGAGKGFCVGQDLKDMAGLDEVSNSFFIDRAMPSFGVYVSKPLIAAVNGWAIGAGLAVAANCDIRVASEKAKFSFPEVKVGMGGGGIELINVMNTSTAVEMMLTGEPIDAQRAFQAGFLNRVVPHESIMQEAERFAAIMAGNAPLTMKMIKAYIFEEKKTLLQQWNLMHALYIRSQEESADAKEGVAAFKEKRKPQFRGE